MQKFKFYIIISIFAFCLLNFSGCATVPGREALPAYDINGVPYVSVASLCELKGISWEYDTFGRTVILRKGAHRINLKVGDTLALVDGSAVNLKHPVDIYQGAVAVPCRFKEQVLDDLFADVRPAAAGPAIASAIKKIVIDAGHGGYDPGAIGRTGLREKDVNLDIAKRLALLLREGGVEVIMTRSSDTFISLSQRVNIANRSRADIFISIHSNANRVRALSGFEAYYISPGISDAKRALSSAKYSPLALERNYFSHSGLNLKATLWDMIYTSNRAESIELARAICRSVGRELDTRVLGVKGANFYVLKGVEIPAILIEVGYLSNYNEERLLRNNFYRQQVAETLKQGIGNYARDYYFAEAN